MTFSLSLTHDPERWSDICQTSVPEGWIGYCSGITFGESTPFSGEQIQIQGFSRQEVIDRVIEELKSRGLTGNLKVC